MEYESSEIKVMTNYFKIVFDNDGLNTLFKYNIDFTPDIPDNSRKLRQKIVNEARKDIQKSIGHHKFIGSVIYSVKNCDEEISISVKCQEIDYVLNLKCVQLIDENNPERYTFIKVLFNSLLKKLNLEQIGRSHYEMKSPIPISSHDISVLPGYTSGLKISTQGVIINVDVSHRVLRNETVLDRIKANRSDISRIKNELKGCVVMTSYNSRTYRITDIDFDSSPDSEFERGVNEKISYFNYYKEKYNVTIKDKNQPMLIHKHPKTNQKIVLIPELCNLTGLSDAMRNNFRLMKELSKVSNMPCTERIKQTQRLFDIMSDNSQCQTEMDLWNVVIHKQPIEVTGKRLNVGKLIMGEKFKGPERIILDANSDDLDRQIQTKMYSQPKIGKCAIFCSKQDQKSYSKFIDVLCQSVKTFKYSMDRPKQFIVNSNRIEDWCAMLKKNLNPSVEFVIMILPGNKNNPLYKDIKKMMLCDLPIPCQAVCSKTIDRGKNLRSIVNKILIQICAKMGGVPWTISNISLKEKNAMICGLSINTIRGGPLQAVIGFVSSVDKECTRYCSSAISVKKEGSISTEISTAFEKSLEQYKYETGAYPSNVVVYRDGASDSLKQAIIGQEVEPLSRVLTKVNSKGTKIIMILVCKKINVKLFDYGNGNIKNLKPGSLVDTSITKDNGCSEFYMVSQKTIQGSAVPTHYSICYNEAIDNSVPNEAEDISLNELESLTLNLCYTYYNVSGSIRVPSLVQYASRLSTLISDLSKASRGQIIKPHRHLDEEFRTFTEDGKKFQKKVKNQSFLYYI